MEVLTAQDSVNYRLSLNGANVRYVVSRERDQAVFLATNLPDPGPNSVYQLWTLKGAAATPAGLLPKGGTASQLFSVPLGDADSLAVTLEPGPAGSTSPTLPPLSSTGI